MQTELLQVQVIFSKHFKSKKPPCLGGFLNFEFPRFHFGLENVISWQSNHLYLSIGKYTPEEGQETRLPESTCDIVNLFLQNISLKCEGRDGVA